MPHTKAEMAEVAERRAKLIRLRRQGVAYDDPRILALGYSSRSAASKDLIRALETARDEQSAEVSIYRQQENERLDALLEAVWAEAQAGELRAVETVLKLMDRRAKLNGLDSPIRTELSGPDGGAVPLGNGSLAELNKLINIAGETGNADDGEQDAGDDSDR
ncbi:hypothetical protein [Streptomyces sioyaensis]|uniref:hypothetical protein n=1 Tax=Streptomyces sioyaensis TaxID=67364 RepID=UPI0037BCDD61